MSDDNDDENTAVSYGQYQSYLLRLWQESPHAPWRASLQDATTGERRAFSNLESLFTYLEDNLDPEQPLPAGPGYAGNGA